LLSLNSPSPQITYATYTVSPTCLTTRLISIPLDLPTPLMLANHIYWNLGAFATPSASTVLNNTLHLPYSPRAIAIDAIEVPTGALETVASTPLDFTSPKTIGRDIADAHQCGFNCTGYDNSFIIDRPRGAGREASDLVVLSLASDVTGIRMDVRTNQQNLQVYTCNNMNGSIPVKDSQQHGSSRTFVPKYGCVSFVCFLFNKFRWVGERNGRAGGRADGRGERGGPGGGGA